MGMATDCGAIRSERCFGAGIARFSEDDAVVRYSFLSPAWTKAIATCLCVFAAGNPAAGTHAFQVVPALANDAIAQEARPLPGPSGATLVVETCADDGSAASLRGAVAGAASGDTVDMSQLDCGVISLQEGAIAIGVDDLALVGPGQESLTVHGMDSDRIFLHEGHGTLQLRNLTMAHGHTEDGSGGCVASEGNVHLADATVTACSAHDAIGTSVHAGGGGIFAIGDIVLARSTVRDNTATSDVAGNLAGGGLLTWTNTDDIPGNITVTDSTVSGNRVACTGEDVGTVRGGGLHSLGTVTILRSVISENIASSASIDGEEESITRGGGVSAFGLNIEDSLVTGNSVLNSGGALDTAGGGVFASGAGRISGSTLAHNHAGMTGGGAVQFGGVPGVSAIEIINSTISDNSSGFVGGGLMITDELTLRNSTVAFNRVEETSPFGGGGVVLGSNDTIGAFQIESSIISNNSSAPKALLAPDLTGFFVEEPLNIVGAHNLVGQASAVNLPADTIGEDPLLLPLADNGGATSTHALSVGSPAIDSGENATGLAFDQRGVGYLRDFGNAADIGAFEHQPEFESIFLNGFETR